MTSSAARSPEHDAEIERVARAIGEVDQGRAWDAIAPVARPPYFAMARAALATTAAPSENPLLLTADEAKTLRLTLAWLSWATYARPKPTNAEVTHRTTAAVDIIDAAAGRATADTDPPPSEDNDEAAWFFCPQHGPFCAGASCCCADLHRRASGDHPAPKTPEPEGDAS